MLKKTVLIIVLTLAVFNIALAKTATWTSPKFYTYYHINYTGIPTGKKALFNPACPQISGQTLDDAYIANDFFTNSGIATDYVYPSSLGKVRFAVDWEQTAVYVGTAYKAVVTVDITYNTWNGSAFSPTTLTNVPLEIFYDPTQTSQTIQSEATYFIKGAHDINVEIKSLVFYNLDGTPFANCTTFFAQNVVLDASIETDSYYKNIESINPFLLNTAGICNARIFDIGDRIIFNWCYLSIPEEFDIEWTFVPANIPTSGQYNFKNNSTRVRVKTSPFEIPKIYNEDGTLVWRIRAVGRKSTNIKEYVFSDWIFPDAGNISSIYSDFKYTITTSKVHESGKNWQYSVTFAEEGKYKEVIGYADGTLRSRQTVTRINTNDSVLVAQRYYDWQGRPAVEALPAPVYNDDINYSDRECTSPVPITDPSCIDYSYGYPNTPQLKYYNKFNGTFGLGQFDVTDENCNPNPAKMTAGAGLYYSPSNPNKIGKNKYIPNSGVTPYNSADPGGWPYVQTEYTPDNTGRVRAKSGVGYDYRLGGGHETKFYYGNPLQPQLDRLFGNEVGYDTLYTKEMTVDGNGTVSVAYKDGAGRVIATALAGDATITSSLIPLPSSSATQSMAVDLLATNNRTNPNSNTIESSFTHLVSTIGLHTFQYSFEKEQYELCSLCYDCIYDLELSITDECGTELVPEENRKYTIGPEAMVINGVCETDPAFAVPDFSLTLSIGAYTITKKLTVNAAAVNNYADYHMANSTCILSYEDFAAEYEPGVVNHCDDVCTSCVQPVLCDAYKMMLVADISPGGQYAPSIRATNPDYPGPSGTLPVGAIPEFVNTQDTPDTENPYSIFYNHSTNPDYIPSSGDLGGAKVTNYTTLSFSVDFNGVSTPINQLSPQQIFDNFDPAWALQLLSLHPEYCYYTYCLDNLVDNSPSTTSSSDFDFAMMGTEYIDDANDLFYLDPVGSYNNSFGTEINDNGTTVADPFFVANPTLLPDITAYMNDIAGTGYTIWQMAAMMQYGTENIPATACLSDGYWQSFKSLYLSQKMRVVQQHADNTVCDVEELTDFLEDCKTTAGCDAAEDECGCLRRIIYSSYGAGGSTANGIPEMGGENPGDLSFDEQADLANSQLDEHTNNTCYGMRAGWKAKFLQCDQINTFLNDNINVASDTADFNDLLNIMGQICALGAGPNDIYGANFCSPAITYNTRIFANPTIYDAGGNITLDPVVFSTFNDAITHYFTKWGIENSAYCNYLMIDMPKGPGHSYGDTKYLDACACQYLLDKENEFNTDADGYCTPTEYMAGQTPPPGFISSTWLVDCFVNNFLPVIPRKFMDMNAVEAARIVRKWLDEDPLRGDDLNDITEKTEFKGYLIITGMATTESPVDIGDYANLALGIVPASTLANQPLPMVPRAIACQTCIKCSDIDIEWGKFVNSGIIPEDEIPTEIPFPPTFPYLQAFTHHLNLANLTNFYSVELYDFWVGCGGSDSVGTKNKMTTMTVMPPTDPPPTCEGIGPNLVVNGGFESGNTDFTTGYTYYTGPLPVIMGEAEYAIVTSPHVTHTDFNPCGDYSGSGNQMVVNGDVVANTDVWCQSITVAAGTDYIFSGWLTSVHPSNPAQLYIQINSSTIGGLINATSTTCNWQQFNVYWNSGISTTANVCIRNNNTIAGGNDFALDDLTMHECGIPPVQVELCDHPMMPDITVEAQTCDDYYASMASFLTELAYEEYLKDERDAFVNNYTAHCLGVINSEQLTMQFTDSEYHYTLYYYDQADNLVRTIPPAGVNPITLNSTIQGQINAYRLNPGSNTPYLASHTLPTDYRFNTLNQVVWQDMPDASYTQFWYDWLGRIVLSQSGRQRQMGSPSGHKVFSYTLYDALGRIKEVGQVSSCLLTTSGFPDNMVVENLVTDTTAYRTWIESSTRTEITRTFYDAPHYEVAGFVPQNLRGRVATVTIARNNVLDAMPLGSCTGCSTNVNRYVYDEAYHYSYDIHGNVNTLIEETPGLDAYDMRYTRTDYEYDLISGKANLVAYQRGKTDQLYHRYAYDADNRITSVEYSADSLIWKKLANYDYYVHGPLARTELGDMQVQGLDYAYTLQGWIKAVNGATLNGARDIGGDGNTGAANQYVAKDAFGFALFYNKGDYDAIGGSSLPFLPDNSSSAVGTHLNDYGLYNGNIAGMQTALADANQAAINVQFNAYQYDQLNRIKNKTVFEDNTGGNAWAGISAGNAYKEQFSYDANGNITNANRYDATNWMDIMIYNYNPGTNQLHGVDEFAPPTSHVDDIEDQADDNYTYDDDGNLIADVAEEIANIEWTAYGKIWKISRISGSTKADLEFEYNPMGHRTLKIVKPAGTLAQPNSWTYTYYRRDASGNIMANYQTTATNSEGVRKLRVTEFNLYGSSRLGIIKKPESIGEADTAPIPLPTMVSTRPDYTAFNDAEQPTLVPQIRAFAKAFGVYTTGNVKYTYGTINYELSNHLGNVLTVISDRKLPIQDGTEVGYFTADILRTQDYYAFGSSMPGRSFGAQEYKFGFNGKENDSETGTQDYGMRIYNPSLGKFLSVDPLSSKYPELTPYQFASNRPIDGIDLDGLEFYGPNGVVINNNPLIGNAGVYGGAGAVMSLTVNQVLYIQSLTNAGLLPISSNQANWQPYLAWNSNTMAFQPMLLPVYQYQASTANNPNVNANQANDVAMTQALMQQKFVNGNSIMSPWANKGATSVVYGADKTTGLIEVNPNDFGVNPDDEGALFNYFMQMGIDYSAGYITQASDQTMLAKNSNGARAINGPLTVAMWREKRFVTSLETLYNNAAGGGSVELYGGQGIGASSEGSKTLVDNLYGGSNNVSAIRAGAGAGVQPATIIRNNGEYGIYPASQSVP